jgi:heme A synthase
LLALSGHDLLHMLRSGVWVQSIDRFYLILIFADLLFMLVAFRYTRHYPDIFRYSAFVLVTVFIRFSLLAPVYYNAMLSLFSVIFAIAVVYFHNLFTDGRLAYISKNQPPEK